MCLGENQKYMPHIVSANTFDFLALYQRFYCGGLFKFFQMNVLEVIVLKMVGRMNCVLIDLYICLKHLDHPCSAEF